MQKQRLVSQELQLANYAHTITDDHESDIGITAALKDFLLMIVGGVY